MPKASRYLALAAAAAALAVFLGMNWGYLNAQLAFAFRRVPPPPPEAELPEEDPAVASLRGRPDRLSIPSLGIEAPIVHAETRSEEAYQRALRDGVARFPGTAEVGQPGNAYLFGHSSDYPWTPGDYKTAFALLTRIAPGDRVIATDRNGEPFAYEVIETKVVNPRDLSVLDQFGYERRMLTLQTSYPLGTALRRFIVLAELAEDLK